MRYLAFVCLLSGCAADVPTPTFFDVEYRGENAASFTTASGWEVEFEQARAVLGPLRLLHEEHEEHAEVPSGTWVATVADLLVPVAHAHGGEGELSDELVGEHVDRVVVDLLGEAYVGEGRGYEGPVNAFSVQLEPATPLTIGETEGLAEVTAFVTGSARRDGIIVEFVGELPPIPEDPDGEAAQTEEREVDEFELREDGTFLVRIRPALWFADAQFDALNQTDAQGRFVITPTSQVGAAWDAARLDGLAASWEE